MIKKILLASIPVLVVGTIVIIVLKKNSKTLKATKDGEYYPYSEDANNYRTIKFDSPTKYTVGEKLGKFVKNTDYRAQPFVVFDKEGLLYATITEFTKPKF